ncbi:MAG: hypothetical protein HQK99_02425 [Nitrospirae bacterium]|nr:hypothetical protein [Nitrospirota bacterium]
MGVYDSNDDYVDTDTGQHYSLPGLSGSPDLSGTTPDMPVPDDTSGHGDLPPKTDMTPGPTPGTTGPDLSGMLPDMSGIPKTTPMPDKPLTVDEHNTPGPNSQMPGANDPYVKNLYKQNADATAAAVEALKNMPASVGSFSMAGLQGLMGNVLRLVQGMGQKNLVMAELERAQQQLQEHERNLGYNAYHSSIAGSRQQDADTRAAKERREAEHQKAMDALETQFKNNKISKDQYFIEKDRLKAQFQAQLLNPNAQANPPANDNSTPSGTPAAPPATGAAPAPSPTPTPAPAGPGQGQNPNVSKYGAVIGMKILPNGQTVYEHAGDPGKFYDWNGNSV